MVKLIGRNVPIVPSDFERVEHMLSFRGGGIRPLVPVDQIVTGPRSSNKSCSGHRINRAALSDLEKICQRTGELYDLDVEVAAQQLAHRSRKSFLGVYNAIKSLKAKGKLEDAEQATELSAPLVAKLREPRLPTRVRDHIHSLAARELLEHVTDPHKDELLRSLLVDRFGGRTDAPPPDMTLRERNSRQTIALTALLD